jgi:small conductance mechanosensitive channel
MVFGIGYSDDIEKATQVMYKILTDHPNVLSTPEPVVKLHELGNSSVNFICRPWAKTPDYWDVYWDVTRQVKERFDAEGITIPFPQRDIHLYNETT